MHDISMTNQTLPPQLSAASNNRAFIFATCVSLVLAAIGDAGPEIVESGSLFAGYDGPGPLIYLGFAALVALVRGRYVPLAAAALSLAFLFGGFTDSNFARRLVAPAEIVAFCAAWLQVLAFIGTLIFAIAAVRSKIDYQTHH